MGVVAFLADELVDNGYEYPTHPAVLSAATVQELESVIDELDVAPESTQSAGAHRSRG